ncbi:glycosyltransferase [Methanobrevibacter sp. TMH8]|uniref:glycosyltransferase n=1 Tax=Methanobrevibacter sp. TMH8 TaxID=2848611 RepID=UPI001CCD0BC6|nr:glycosyltransferase [Methanobrevibacter sp. TMH8]MBZ9570751.1 glycosyltransferase [Methanobrevibacter sp. TMH8]
MKALLVITGRGMGGDAAIALNIARALEEKGVQCELALDHNAPGILFKNNGYSWHKISVPQAGGHAATRSATAKAGLRTLKAALETRKLIKKLKVDVVVGIIGGGAVVGCIAAKLARIPAVGVVSTPTDTKVCTKLNTSIVFPEVKLYREETLPENVKKSFFPLDPEITKGNRDIALEKIKEIDKKGLFDKNKQSILFSSGSSLFETMVRGLANATTPEYNLNKNYNLFLVGIPLEEEYLDLIDQNKIINLGYIDWIKDLYDLIDLAVLTDDGMMVQEALGCELPVIALTRVKYGRYHNMAGIFPGAVIEANIEDLNSKIEESLINLDEIKAKSKDYSKEILLASENIANIIIYEANKKKK